jgi:hypothetical protein
MGVSKTPPKTLEINFGELVEAMCTNTSPCPAHLDSAHKLWERLEKIRDRDS